MYIPMIAFMECLLVEDKIVKRVKFRNQFVFYGHSCIKQMYLGELEPIPSSTDQCGMFSKADKLCTLQSLEHNIRHCLHIGSVAYRSLSLCADKSIFLNYVKC